MNPSLPLPSPLPDYVSVATIQPFVYFIILSVVWSSILGAMLFLMFFLSTPQIRRTPLFFMNVVAVVSAVVAGFLQVDRMTLVLLHPNTPMDRGVQRTPPVISIILPIFIDCILAVRLYIVYPRSMTSPLHLAVIFIPLVVLKVLRTTNATYCLIQYFQHLDHDPSILEAFTAILFKTPSMRIEWIAGLVDNCWASVWFLWRLRCDIMKRHSSSDVEVTNGTGPNLSSQLQKLFYLGLSSFVFPCILNIIMVIICYKRSIFLDTYTYIFVTNFYLQIFGVLLATIWVSKERSSQRSGYAYPSGLRTTLPFHATVVDPARTRASEDLPPGSIIRVDGDRIDGTLTMRLDSHSTSPVDYVPPKEIIV